MDTQNKYDTLRLVVFLFLTGIGTAFSQGKFLTKSGAITFEASVPSFEEVKATNDKVTAIINTETSDIAALALVKGFRFKVALMEEHFNENYAESDKFPKAKFSGKIEGYTQDTSDKVQNTIIKGTLTFHGVSQKIETPATLQQNKERIKLSAQFKVKPSDFDVEIPSVVSNKLAKEIDIQLNFNLNPK